jgi:hypothetical protein
MEVFMGDMVPFAGMIFSLLLALIIGGFVLMYPLTKRLGQLMELRLQERQGAATRVAELEQVERLAGVVEALREEVAALAERQDFTERLLGSEDRAPAVPALGGEAVRIAEREV